MKTIYTIELPESEERCRKAMSWVGRQPHEVRFEVHKHSQKVYFELKKNYTDVASFIVSDVALLRASMIIKVAITKNTGILPLDMIESLNIKAAKKTRIKPQLKWLIEHQSVIRICVKKGLSSREIAHYLQCESRYKHQVSHTKIGDFIKSKGWKNESA